MSEDKPIVIPSEPIAMLTAPEYSLDYDEFVKRALKRIADSLGISYEQLSRDYLR
ncbi:hypothetical protein [Sphingobium lignivorans]|uniref:Capsid protein n=1 Tax=Sphingobium lignivorans TaxID=2735886 RepID=A0ABR6NF81_9SPHN|nr:hypothetical protein [Sphingobium lignivorans]MBB5985921.1 capsid protein [Sphingobium lignivorans]